jgi:hypothetical protein
MQCTLLARDHWDIFMNDVYPERVDSDECDDVYETLLQDMDWMGTTEEMSSETIPLLTRMLVHDRSAADEMEAFNVVRERKADSKILTKETLGEDTIERLQQMSGNDQAIYYKLKRDFRLDMWENF